MKGVLGKSGKQFSREIKETKKEVSALQTLEPTTNNMSRLRRAIEKLERLEEEEEVYWAQRSRQTWLKDGDKNTKFFHQKASFRRSRNWIRKIQDDGENWRESESEIAGVFMNYFLNIFDTQGAREMERVLQCVDTRISNEMNLQLESPYTEEEILHSLLAMHPSKAPGPDEGLSALIRRREELKLLNGIRIANGAPVVSHLFFADDSLLFVRATFEEAEQVLDILHQYEMASGQTINVDKSEVSFSRNVDVHMQQFLKERLSFKAVYHHEKYLGLPTYIGRSKKAVFSFILDKVWKKVKGWKENHLTKAGKEVLLKAVVQAIPVYIMQCFDIPVSICNQIVSYCRNFWWGKGTDKRGFPWIGWNSLCDPKARGGLGFRDFKSFNKALIAKQIWRVIQYPDSLVAKVLKARYFKRGDIMNASVGYKPSFIWRSLMGSRDLLEYGLIWQVGNGQDIRVWKDKWLPNGAGSHIPPPSMHRDDNMCVAELIDYDSNQWREDMLQLCFPQRIADVIKKIPLGDCVNKDIRVWRLCKDGEFRVKSAYHVARQMNESKLECGGEASIDRSNFWKFMWKVKVPSKVTHTVWRAWKEALALRVNLVKKNFEVDPICALCGEDYEHSSHLFLECPYAQRIWKISLLRLDMETRSCQNFQQWLLEVVLLGEAAVAEMVFMIIWAIWKARNSWIFEGVKTDPDVVLMRAQSYLWEFQKVAGSGGSWLKSSKERNSQWLKPQEGWVKLNTDASKGKGLYGGMGAVIRNHEGTVLGACQNTAGNCLEVEVLEIMAIKMGLLLSSEISCEKVVVSSDNINVVRALQQGVRGKSHYSAIVQDCLSIARRFNVVVFSYSCRESNVAAHILAYDAAKFGRSDKWIGACPNSIKHCISVDS